MRIRMYTISALALTLTLLTRPVHSQDSPPAAQTKKSTPDKKTIRALIAQLGDESFEKRQEAEKKLKDIGRPALPQLRKAAKESADAEVRDHAERLARQIGTGLDPDAVLPDAGLSLGGYVGRLALVIRGGAGPTFLQNPAIQKELSLSEAQIEKINALAKEVRAAAAAFNKNDSKKIYEKIQAPTIKKARELLTTQQWRRMQQIELQMAGPAAFVDPEVQDKLKLTDQQKLAVREAYNKNRKAEVLEALNKKMGNERLKEINAAAMARIMVCITEEQKRAYAELRGEAFHGTLPFVSGPILQEEPKKN
jgi:hypothetical protein